ncbi:hypothetical protein [Vibrio spartinae]|uniref:Uncharacterized protein n=1 Tax=Vibrio spartinae TaxID=1918945 RepID=A0A1N6MB99_9VIBR|nr:hypothetical protein [Vibrio spartinae]SIO96738.1 hypothetical protein VSP9026_04551 [Vibrio spartinae]
MVRLFRAGRPEKTVLDNMRRRQTKKDFLVRLSSLKDELAHRAPMLLKPKNEIVRQNLGPKAGEMNIVALLFEAQ